MGYNKDQNKIKEYTINDEYTYMQCSLFYRRGDGKNMIRVFNLCFSVSNYPKEIYDLINTEYLGVLNAQKIIMNVNSSKNLFDTVSNSEKEIILMYKSYFNNSNMIKKELSEEIKIFALYFRLI